MAHALRGYELALVANGDQPRLEEGPKGFRFPGPGWVRIKVAASAVTAENVAAVREEAAAHSLWHGTVCSGVVEAATACATADADPDALEWVPKRGDRVAVLVGSGAHASHVVCPWRCALPIPDSLPLAEAVALLASVVPAYLAVFGDGGMAPGARVAVLGAETPTGTAACQLLASMANTTVMAVCSSGAALGDIMRQGVDAAVAEADLPVPCWRSGKDARSDTSGAAAWGRAVRGAVSAALRDERRSSAGSDGSTGWDAHGAAEDAGSESSDAESASADDTMLDGIGGGIPVDDDGDAGYAAARLGGPDADVGMGFDLVVDARAGLSGAAVGDEGLLLVAALVRRGGHCAVLRSCPPCQRDRVWASCGPAAEADTCHEAKPAPPPSSVSETKSRASRGMGWLRFPRGILGGGAARRAKHDKEAGTEAAAAAAATAGGAAAGAGGNSMPTAPEAYAEVDVPLQHAMSGPDRGRIDKSASVDFLPAIRLPWSAVEAAQLRCGWVRRSFARSILLTAPTTGLAALMPEHRDEADDASEGGGATPMGESPHRPESLRGPDSPPARRPRRTSSSAALDSFAAAHTSGRSAMRAGQGGGRSGSDPKGAERDTEEEEEEDDDDLWPLASQRSVPHTASPAAVGGGARMSAPVKPFVAVPRPASAGSLSARVGPLPDPAAGIPTDVLMALGSLPARQQIATLAYINTLNAALLDGQAEAAASPTAGFRAALHSGPRATSVPQPATGGGGGGGGSSGSADLVAELLGVPGSMPDDVFARSCWPPVPPGVPFFIPGDAAQFRPGDVLVTHHGRAASPTGAASGDASPAAEDVTPNLSPSRAGNPKLKPAIRHLKVPSPDSGIHDRPAGSDRARRRRVATPGHMRRRLINHHINTRTSVWDAYESMRELGVGMTGRVHLARHRRTGVLYAVKSIDLDKMAAAYLEELRSEIAFLTLLDHPNVITLYETFEDDTEGRLYLVLEYCSGGELFERLHEQKGSHFGEAHAAALVYQMLSAVAYCHRMGIAHRDLKLENFLLSSRDHDARVVLIDFGLSNRYAAGSGDHELADSLTNSAEQRGGTIRKMTTVLGTAYYTAPEILAKAPSYSEVCDVWSLGVIGYMLLSGSPPFRGRTDAEILERVRRGRYTLSTPVWQGVSDEAKSFVRACLKYNPDRRPTAVECRRMAWFQRVAEQAASSPPGRRPDLDIVRAAMPVPVRAAALRRSIRPGALGVSGSGSTVGDDGAASLAGSAANTPRAAGDTPLGADAISSMPAALASAGGEAGMAGTSSAGTDASEPSASGPQADVGTEAGSAAPASPTDDGFSALLARQIDPHVAAGLQDYAESSRLKRAALAAVAFSAAPEEVASLRDTFCALDSDGTGILSLRQIADALVRGSRPPIAREDADAMVTRFCADGQSVMGYSEFLAAAMPRSVLLSEPRLREAFGRLDADGSGFITVPTLKALMGDLYTDDELAGMIREADSDQDGRLSFEDFQGVVLGQPPVIVTSESPGESATTATPDATS